MAVEVENASTSDGANVQQSDWSGGDHQLWTFESV
jgi:endo-1,4-beta-xylanase